MSSQIFTIQGAVMSVLNELESPNVNKEYARLVTIAIEGYRHLKLHAGVSIDVAYLTMNDAHIVALPADYEMFLAVAIEVEGRLWTLTVDETIPLPDDVVKCETPLHKLGSGDAAVGRYFFHNHRRGQSMVDGLYALGGGMNISYFREDKRNKTLVFSAKVPKSQVIVEYVSNGADVCETTAVPSLYYETLKAWIHHRRIYKKRDYSRAEKLDALRYFEDQRELAITTEMMPTKDEWLDLISSGTRQSVKR